MFKFKRIIFLFRIVISIGIIFILFKFIPYTELLTIYVNSEKSYIIFAFFIFFLCNVVAVLRWKYLLLNLGILVSIKELIYASFSGYFFNLFFPSFLAGDIFRLVSVSVRYGEKNKVASSVFMDRFSGCVGIVIVALFSFFFTKDFLDRYKILFIIIILNLIILGLPLFLLNKRVFSIIINFISKKFRDRLCNFYNQIYFFKEKPTVFFISIIFSAIIQVMISLSFFFVSKAFNVNIYSIYFLVLVPIIMLIALIPITVLGIGSREAASVYFFSLVGIDKSVSLGMSLLHFVFSILLGILGGLIYVLIYHRWFLVNFKK